MIKCESMLGIIFILTIFAMGFFPAMIFNNPLYLFIWVLFLFLEISGDKK